MKKRRPLQPAPIRILGARSHNLKNVSVSIPIGRLTVVTGVSGSGQVFARLRHAVRRRTAAIRGVALDLCASVPGAPRPAGRRLDRARASRHRPRAEERGPQRPLDRRHPDRDPRLAAAALRPRGTTFCPECGVAAVPGGVDRAVEELCASEEGARATLVAPGAPGREPAARRKARAGSASRGQRPARIAEFKRAGFFRALSPGGETVEIGDDGRVAPGRRRGAPHRRGAIRRRGSGPPGDRLGRRDGVFAGRHARRRGSKADVRTFPPRTPLPELRPRVPRSRRRRCSRSTRRSARVPPARASGASSAWTSRR